MAVRIIIDEEKCTGCGECVEACAPGVLEVNDVCKVVNLEECTACGICVDRCPEEAITLEEG